MSQQSRGTKRKLRDKEEDTTDEDKMRENEPDKDRSHEYRSHQNDSNQHEIDNAVAGHSRSCGSQGSQQSMIDYESDEIDKKKNDFLESGYKAAERGRVVVRTTERDINLLRESHRRDDNDMEEDTIGEDESTESGIEEVRSGQGGFNESHEEGSRERDMLIDEAYPLPGSEQLPREVDIQHDTTDDDRTDESESSDNETDEDELLDGRMDDDRSDQDSFNEYDLINDIVSRFLDEHCGEDANTRNDNPEIEARINNNLGHGHALNENQMEEDESVEEDSQDDRSDDPDERELALSDLEADERAVVPPVEGIFQAGDRRARGYRRGQIAAGGREANQPLVNERDPDEREVVPRGRGNFRAGRRRRGGRIAAGGREANQPLINERDPDEREVVPRGRGNFRAGRRRRGGRIAAGGREANQPIVNEMDPEECEVVPRGRGNFRAGRRRRGGRIAVGRREANQPLVGGMRPNDREPDPREGGYFRANRQEVEGRRGRRVVGGGRVADQEAVGNQLAGDLGGEQGRREQGEGQQGEENREGHGELPIEGYANNGEEIEDLLLTDEEAEMQDNGPERPLFQGIGDNAGMNLELQYKVELTAMDHLLETLATALRFGHTYENIVHDLKRTEGMFYDINIPTSKPQLWNCLGRDKRNLIYRLYCTICKDKIAHGPKPDRRCTCGKCGPGLPETYVGTFIQLRLGPQLKELLSLPNIAEALRYKFNRVKQDPSAIEDIYDGAEYKLLEAGREILSNANNFSLTFWTDGVKLAESSHATTYPILMQVNELHPYARCKHLLLAGVWVGRKSPCTLSTIMLPVARDIKKLNVTGVTWKPDGVQEVTSKFVAPLFTSDSIAKPNMCRMRQFNGRCGCPTCLAPGLQLQRSVRVYPAQPFPLRTHEGIKRDAAIAFNTGQVTNGVKGCSALTVIPKFNLVRGVALDSMHNAFEGVGKQTYSLWRKNTGEPYYIGREEEVIDERLESIKPPSQISRQPRSIALYANWKASEWRNFVQYYSVPCLRGILPRKYLEHWSKFVEAIFLLHKSSISEVDLQRADNLLKSFIQDYQTLYGLRNMSFNVHLLGHAVDCVRHWGPLWVYATYHFESFNQDIVKSVTSPHHRGDQIVTRFLMRKFVMQMARENVIAEQTQDTIGELLNTKRIIVPPGMPEGHYFAGKGVGTVRAPSAQEIQMIRDAGFLVTVDTEVSVYKMVFMHGVKYQVVPPAVERKFRDDVVFSRNGFWIASYFLRFENAGNTICGLIGQKLSDNGSLYGIDHMRSVVLSRENAFISYHDVIAPGILIDVEDGTCAVPLSNCYEVD